MSERIDPGVVFSEERPLLPRIVGITVVVGGFVILVAISCVIRTLKGFPADAIPVVTGGLVLSLCYDCLLALSKRATEVGQDKLILRSRPLPFLVNRTVAFAEVEQVTARGGSVQLRLKSGRSVSIPTRKADELAEAVQARMK